MPDAFTILDDLIDNRLTVSKCIEEKHLVSGSCHDCGREKPLDLERVLSLQGDMIIQDIGPKLRCSDCKGRNVRIVLGAAE
jgi:hypothetical protein